MTNFITNYSLSVIVRVSRNGSDSLAAPVQPPGKHNLIPARFSALMPSNAATVSGNSVTSVSNLIVICACRKVVLAKTGDRRPNVGYTGAEVRSVGHSHWFLDRSFAPGVG